MHPDKSMKRVVNGKRYSVSTSTLLASDEHFERSGRNTFLYRTRGGAFFRVDLTQWENERDTLTPLTREQATELYEQLPEHNVEYEDAFDTVVEEAHAGPPSYYGKPMKQSPVYMPDEMWEWLKAQPRPASETIRALIEAAMKQ